MQWWTLGCGDLYYQADYKVIGFVVWLITLCVSLQIYSLPFLVLLYSRDDLYKFYHSDFLFLYHLVGIAQQKVPIEDRNVEGKIVQSFFVSLHLNCVGCWDRTSKVLIIKGSGETERGNNQSKIYRYSPFGWPHFQGFQLPTVSIQKKFPLGPSGLIQ